ncbi:hypothetical protein P3S67_018926 [Capsicum chacoense]
MGVQDFDRLRVEIKWKGSSKGISLNLESFNRRSVKKNFSKEECLKEDEGIVEWNEEFLSVCNFSGWKDGVFQPWEVVYIVINGTNKGPNQKVPVLSTATLNLADFAFVAGDKQEGIEIFVPLEVSVGNFKSCLSLCLVVNLVELRNTHEASETFPKFIMSAPVSPNPGKALLTDKNGGGSLKAGLRKDSLDEDSEGESEEGKEDTSVQKSFSYEALVNANHAGGSFCSNTSSSSSDEDLDHYNHHISDTRYKKRKLSFKSPKTKGEPLLKKHYGEDGGDNIDFDRRQLYSSDESSSRGHKSVETSPISVSEFRDESFAVGSWEQKEIISRDGQMKLQTQIFFASIDQLSERAAGESACTALVAVIADWFHCNPEDMPIKSQLDSLICEGSMQWRDLYENETYRERFPDKHLTSRQFSRLKCEEIHFLHGTMSIDNIWDEISKSAQETPRHGDSCVYIVSLNDHFFILKVEKDAYYIIDTLGERFFKGCNQAYILKFDQDTTIMQVLSESQQSDDKPSCDRKEKTDVKEAADERKIVMSTNSDDSM